MTPLWILFVTLPPAALITAACTWLWTESESSSSAKLIAELSKSVNLPRLPRERLSAWSDRVRKAHDELSDASIEFMEAASRAGTVNRVGERGVQYWLPPGHPASIHLARARGLRLIAPSGPYRDVAFVWNRGVE